MYFVEVFTGMPVPETYEFSTKNEAIDKFNELVDNHLADPFRSILIRNEKTVLYEVGI